MNDVYSTKPLRRLNKICPPGYIDKQGMCVLDIRRNRTSPQASVFSQESPFPSPVPPPTPPVPPPDPPVPPPVPPVPPPDPPVPPPDPTPQPEPAKKKKSKGDKKDNNTLVVIGETVGGAAALGVAGAAIYKNRRAILTSAQQTQRYIMGSNNYKKFDVDTYEDGMRMFSYEDEGVELPLIDKSGTTRQRVISQTSRSSDSAGGTVKHGLRNRANRNNKYEQFTDREANSAIGEGDTLLDTETEMTKTNAISERTNLLPKNENADTFPKQVETDRGSLPKRKFGKGDGSGGGAKTESADAMNKRREAAKMKADEDIVTADEDFLQQLNDLKSRRDELLDKKNNPEKQAEEIDMDALDKELNELDELIPDYEESYGDTGMFGGEKIDSVEVLKQKSNLAQKIADEEAEKEAASQAAQKVAKNNANPIKTINKDGVKMITKNEGFLDGGAEGAAEGGVEYADLSAAQAAAEGLGEEAATGLIGDIVGVGGATEAATTAATVTMEAILAGEVATQAAAVYVMGGLVGGVVGAAVAYAVTEAGEAIYDAVSTTDREYAQQRVDELGTHEMDRREVSYKLQELGALEDYYEKKVNQGYSVSNKDPASIAQHQSDIATLNSIKKNIDSLNESFRNDIPVYSVVEDGFNKDSLSSADAEEFKRLNDRVDNAQNRLNYDGAAAKEKNQRHLDMRKEELAIFMKDRSNASIATGFVNKPSDQEMEILLAAYDESGMDAFKNLSQEEIALLGITKAVNERDQQNLIDAKYIEPVEVSSEEAAAYWKEEQMRWAAEKNAEENDVSGSASIESMAKRAYYSEHEQEVAATENEDQQTAETSHQDDARGLAENVE